MTTKILTAAVLALLLVGSVAFVGPALAHGDEPTAPVDGATANDTWHGHTGATIQAEWPAWMADHATNGQAEWPAWMTDHVTQEQVEWMESDGADRHVGATPLTHRGGYGHGC